MKKISILIFALIVVLAVGLRIRTLWMPHWNAEEAQNVVLAYRLNEGDDGYHLRTMFAQVLPMRGIPGSAMCYPETSDRQPQTFAAFGTDLLRGRFIAMPPLFPLILRESHNAFLGPFYPFAILRASSMKGLEKFRSNLIQVQAWATLVPFVSSLVLLLLTFFVGRRFFGEATALLAMLLVAVNPVDVLASNRLVVDAFSAALIFSAALVFRHGERRGDVLCCVWAGFLAGFSVLADYRAWLLLIVIPVYVALRPPSTGWRARGARIYAKPFFWAFFFPMIALSLQWILFLPGENWAARLLEYEKYAAARDWAQAAGPISLIFYTAGLLAQSPAFIFVPGAFTRQSGSDERDELVFLATLAGTFWLFFSLDPWFKNFSNLLIAIPAVSLLAAQGALGFFVRAKNKSLRWAGIGFLGLSVVLSIVIAITANTPVATRVRWPFL